MINTFKRFLKSSHLGCWLFPKIGKIYRAYEVPRRQKRLQEHGLEIIRKVIEIGETEGFTVVPHFGTLLGFIRDNGFIPHDDDIDIAVLPPCRLTPKEITILLVEKYGFTFTQNLLYKGETKCIQVRMFDIGVDFFFMDPYEDKLRLTSLHWDKNIDYNNPRANSVDVYDFTKCNGLVKINIKGLDIPIPDCSETWLLEAFGKGWKVPDPNFTDEDTPIRQPLSDFGYAIKYDEVKNDVVLK